MRKIINQLSESKFKFLFNQKLYRIKILKKKITVRWPKPLVLQIIEILQTDQ